MNRVKWKWFGLAVAGMTFTSIQAQDGVWKPVTEHRARYESIDGTQPMTLIGKPITGRSKVDQAIQPASFGADQRTASPMPPAPPMNPTGYETLGYPRNAPMVSYPQGAVPMQTAAASPGIRPVPMTTMPNGTVVYPNGMPNGVVNYPMQDSMTSMPQYNGNPVIVNGQVVNGQPINGQVVNGPMVNGQVVGSPVMGGSVYDNGMFPNSFCPDGNCATGLSDRFYLQSIHGSPGVWYGSAEFVLYSLSSDKSPPLVITGPQNTTSINSPGVSTLYGGTLNTDPGFGGKVTMGAWFNRCQTWGMFGSFFTTGTQQQNTIFDSPTGAPFLARPFFNNSPVNGNGSTHTPAEDIELVAATGILGGSVSINRTSLLRGADLNFRFNWCNYTSCTGRFAWNLDKYFGVKYMGLDESLIVTEDLTVLANNPPLSVNDRIIVRDSFMTRNNFIGANLGLISEMRLGRFFFDAHGSIALGGTAQEVSIMGSTTLNNTINNAPNSSTVSGGLLAQQTNSGIFNRAQFSVIPEVGLKLGWQVSDHFRLFAGMDFTYWSNVVRPGQQIDYTVNASQLPTVANGNLVKGSLNGDPRPAFNWQNSNMWLTGFSAGVSWVF
ncbi:MAG TPA: BBP7 family outer membrane beta-barrel protein [Gemmatales bacterium]|nr:BBP7 family outer membrane beta-barrel protein [Gemmatales bacterium]